MRPVLPLLVVLSVVGCTKEEEPQSTTGGGSNLGPDDLTIEITEPVAGAHLPVGSVDVEGTQTGLSNVTLNGVGVDASSGGFAAEVELERGINNLEARGEKGTTYRLTRRAVLAGEFAEPSGSIDEALGLRINQGGLDAMGGIVGGLLDPKGLSKGLAKANPLYESFVFDAHVTSLGFAPLEMEFQPAQGELALDVVLPDVEALVFIDTLLDFDLEVTAEEARIGGVLALDTDGNGHLVADFSNASVSITGFDYDTSLIPGDFSFGEGTLEGIFEGVLLDQVEVLVPTLLQDQLSTLELAFELDLLGTPVSVRSAFRSAFVDRDGVQLVADLDVEVPGTGTKSAPGYLTAAAARPTPNTVDDMTMSLSDDLVNRLLFEVWSGGLVDMTLSTDDGSLPAEYLADFGADEGTLTLDAKLPPVLVQKGEVTELQIGELHARLETPDNPNFSYLDLALSAKIPVDLEVVAGELTVALGDPELVFIIRDTDWPVDHSAITVLLEENLPIDELIGSLGLIAIELPEIAGISLENAAINRDPSGVFTNIAADL
jgi:hypothetical protein